VRTAREEAGVNVLDGLRVIDLTTGVAGPSCTKILADFGAEVIKVEPRAGDPGRDLPPFAGDEPGLERSLTFLYLNTSKRSVTIDPEHPEGAALLRGLIERADILVEDLDPGAMAELGLGYDELREDHPQLVYASITPWGQNGPYVELGLRASELTLQGMGGPVNATGVADREPLKLAGNLAQMQAGMVAAYAIVATVYRVEGGGGGDHIDVSIYETQMGTRDRRTSSLTTYAYTGYSSRRPEAGAIPLAQGLQPTSDGYVNIWAVGPKIDQFVTMIGREDLAGDARLRAQRSTIEPALVDELQTAYFEWSMAKTAREAVTEAQSFGLYAGVVNTPEKLVTDPHYRERGVWERIDHPAIGEAEYPGRPFILSETPRPPARRAPLLGEHTAEVLTELLEVPRERLPRLRALGAI
jgi:crotonobetainyl-CoA:carnitine CoA-transferase CaiB-like acyl-CoA transferase